MSTAEENIVMQKYKSMSHLYRIHILVVGSAQYIDILVNNQQIDGEISDLIAPTITVLGAI